MIPTILKAILKLCTTKILFNYFRRRYDEEQMKELNNVIEIRGKIRNIQLSSKFSKEYLYKRVAPRFITSRIIQSQARPSSTIERAFLNDEIGKNQIKLTPLFRKLHELLSKVHLFLSFFDWIRFCRYLSDIDRKKRNQIEAKNFQNL